MQLGKVSAGLRVLMVGYNGANNTGAEALLQADIADVRSVLGPEARITVPTLNEENLRRYLVESPTLRIARIPPLFFAAVRRLVKENDLILLVEGSTYMDTWGSPLLWFFLWATRCAAAMGKSSLAYAVDAGALNAANQRRVRLTASRTGLIIARTQAAAERLRALGVTAPLRFTADNAFTFHPRSADEGWLGREWPAAAAGAVGFAMVDFSLWPAVMRPWGAKDRLYRWPYYFSRSRARTRSREAMARAFAAEADRLVAAGTPVALICMEQLDEAFARTVHGLMQRPEGARIFSARELDASRMTALLRSLRLLVTSRFHAAVLSMEACVPQIAVGHDMRLRTLYQDLGLADEWFFDPKETPTADLFAGLHAAACRLLENPALQREALRDGCAAHRDRADMNRKLLAQFVQGSAATDHEEGATCVA